jgi:hypothetical protein
MGEAAGTGATPTSLFRGLRVGIPSGDTRFFPFKDLLEGLGAAVSFAIDRENIPRDDATLKRIVLELAENYDILLIPLTFEYYGSLRIAEIVHVMNVNLKLIVVSQSTGLQFSQAVPLFDYYISLSETRAFTNPPPKFIETIQNQNSARLNERQLDTSISTLLTTQSCFVIDHYSGRHPELEIHAILRHYKSRRYLEDAKSDVVEQSDLDEAVRKRNDLPPRKSNMPEWYVSYAWGDDRTPEGRVREEIVDRLCEAAKAQDHTILRDKDTLSLGGTISAFMRRIGTGDRVFVILSDKYLRSPHCMFELSELWRTSRQEGKAFLERVRIYALRDANIFKPTDWADWAILETRTRRTRKPRTRARHLCAW